MRYEELPVGTVYIPTPYNPFWVYVLVGREDGLNEWLCLVDLRRSHTRAVGEVIEEDLAGKFILP